tara:strand:+ start:471 stop:809 length:339 start_codon:yes stop_codon:yes gene_type:complete
MLKVSELFTGEYLRKENLIDDDTGAYKVIKLAIKDIEKKMVAIPMTKLEKEVAVVYFEKTDKGMCLNATNRNHLISKFGNRPKEWIGKVVSLGVDPSIKFKGKVVGGLIFKD